MKTNYQHAKAELLEVSKNAKKTYKTDLPAIRMIINDTVDYICKTDDLSEYQQNLLANYACTLHPRR